MSARDRAGRAARVAPALLAVACVLAPSPAPGQATAAVVVPDTVAVGDVAIAAVRVETAAGWRVLAPDSLPVSGDVENAGPLRISVDTTPDRRVWTTYRYPLVAWRPGTMELPAAEVVVAGPEGRGEARLEVAIPPLQVRSVLPADTAGLEPRPPKDVIGADRRAWPWLLGLLVLAAAIAAVAYMMSRRPAPAPAPPAAPDARRRALEELDRMRDSGLVGAGDPLPLYAGLAEVLRDFVGSQDRRWGEDLTTRELRARMVVDVGSQVIAELDRVLAEADLVKFARHRPTSHAGEASWRAARAWVEGFRGGGP